MACVRYVRVGARRRHRASSIGVQAAFVVLFLLRAAPTIAQDTPHHHHPPPPEGETPHSTGGAVPMEVSGTSWLPATTPMYGWMRNAAGWQLMGHANVFAQFLFESGEIHRRGHQFGSVNWAMGSATRLIGSGHLTLRTMLSAEPWTIGGCGYPDLLATGEICRRDTIHDRQHPHDLFMEAAAEYDGPLTGTARWQLYVAPVGEPALGPPAFPHRPSSFPNPLAPIAHHWLDSTHISFGVLTGGIYNARWKVEGSVFNGREPDPVRTNFDFAPLDAVAGRLSVAPTSRLTLQVSAGHLPEAEAGPGRLPRTDVTRATASGSYQRGITSGMLLAATLAYGVNSQDTVIPEGRVHQTGHAVLAEAAVTIRDRHTTFARYEIVGKPAHDFHADQYAALVFTVGKLQLGYARRLVQRHSVVVSTGGVMMVSLVPPLLAPYYGGRVTPGFGIFLNLRPQAHPM